MINFIGYGRIVVQTAQQILTVWAFPTCDSHWNNGISQFGAPPASNVDSLKGTPLFKLYQPGLNSEVVSQFKGKMLQKYCVSPRQAIQI